MRLGLALLSASVLAGCGGGDDRLSRAEFVERATAVCDSFDERVDALGEPQSLAEIETLGQELGEILDEGLAELRELEPPEELEEPYERYLASGDEVADQLDELVAAAAAGDREAVERAAADGEAISERAVALAEAAAIPGCEDD
jgi:hypothetical protein